jgi:two-component system nitrogen regulation sensor histidine kinase GlnL
LEHRGPTRRIRTTGTKTSAGAQSALDSGRADRKGTELEQHASPIVGGLPRQPQSERGSGGPQRHERDSESAGEFLFTANVDSKSEQPQRAPTDTFAAAAAPLNAAVAPNALSILDSLSTATLIITRDGSVIFMNAGAEQLFGLSRNQAANRTLYGLLPGLDKLRSLAERADREGQTFGQPLTFSVPHQERMNIQVACRISPFRREADGQLIVELFDATQWRQIDREKALISQHGVSRRIIRQLAHEIRNPLGGLRGAAQLLERELTDPGQREYTQVIIGEADRLVALTDALLGPTRKPEKIPANVHEIFERVVLLMESEVPSSVSVFRDYDPSLPTVTVDKDQIIQALLNLGRNAVQAIDNEGHIIVRTRALTNFVIGSTRHKLVASLEVEDNGPGIPADLAESIFYPLVTGRESGTGLGLPLAQDLVSRNGGLIEYESAPGRTVFIVRLPLESSAV